MPGRHAILGPSAAYRWLVCTPSARFEEQIEEDESEYAEEGTLAHDLAALEVEHRRADISEAVYRERHNKIYHAVVAFYMTKGVNGKPLNKDQARNEFGVMQEHANDWAAILMDYGGEILVEQEYDISAYVPLGFGTADGTNITPKVLYVSDFKYGAGVRVQAVGNKQMMLYGVGALVKAVQLGHKPETVVLTIFQPRAGGTSTWEISVAELLKWAEMEVKPQALLAIAGQGEFIPGGHCQFCKARLCCSAYFDAFKDVKKIHDSRRMTDKDRAIVLTYGEIIGSWAKKIAEDTARKMQNGVKVKGFKLVAGRGRRQFKNEDDVVDILLGAGLESDDIFNSELRSLTDLEKTLGPKKFKAMFADAIINIEGKPQVADEDDERPAIGRSAADEYDDEEDDLL